MAIEPRHATIIVIVLCICQLANGCKSQPVNEAGLYQRPGWLDRRLDDWNTHHGYPLATTKAVALYTLVGVGTVALLVASCIANDDTNQQKTGKKKQDDSWFWQTSPYES